MKTSQIYRADLVFKHDLPNLTMDDWEVTVSQVDFPPGLVGKVHHHAGFVLAYCAGRKDREQSFRAGRKNLSAWGNVLRTAGKHARSVQQRERKPAGQPASAELREERRAINYARAGVESWASVVGSPREGNEWPTCGRIVPDKRRFWRSAMLSYSSETGALLSCRDSFGLLIRSSLFQ